MCSFSFPQTSSRAQQEGCICEMYRCLRTLEKNDCFTKNNEKKEDVLLDLS